MPRDESSPSGGGALRWARHWWRALVAELVATALLVWLGVAAMVPVRGAASVQLTHPALAFGFVVVACAMGCGPASGAHMNPAVTLAALVYGQLAPGAALGYALAQTAGATLGFGALLATTPAAAMRDSAGCTLPAPGVAPLAAAALEAAITGALALACCGAWAAHDPARPDHTVPVKLGLVVAGLIYSAGHATGASLNPARSFGAAVLQGEWRHHWVYWAGPLLGAALAALLHRFVLRVPPGPPAPHRSRTHTDADPDVELPLNDKP